MGGVGKSFADQNDFAGLIVMSLPFAWVLWQDARRFSRMLLVGYFGLALWCVMRTGSRMGACGVAAAAAMAIVALPKRYRLRIVLVAPLVVAAVWLVLPQEIQRRYLTIVDSSYGPANAAKSADNRSRYFWIALDLFQERPLLGYGPGGFLQASGVNQAPHNVYGQVLSELGCLGALAFCLILFGMAQNSHTALLHTSSPHMLARRTALAASAAVALALGMGWGLHFLYWHVWLWFAAFQVIALKCLVPVWSVHSYSAWQPNRPSAPVLHSKWQQSL
jgi:O-antigen ligase